MPLDERLANYIIEGTRDGLIADLDKKRAEGAAPLDIVNGPLMAGMAEVGRLFNANELIVAEVLQSAEAMKAAVSHLEQFMEKADTAKRGKVVLATVKGDVHDIGKNLVEIILKNNGYDVVNLGIKVPPEELIKAYQEHQPDAIGLVRAAGEERAANGDYRERFERCGDRDPAAGGRRGAFGKVHADENRAKLRQSGVLRKRCDDRTAADERIDGSRDARSACCATHTSSGNGASVSTSVTVHRDSEGDAVAARSNGLADSERCDIWIAKCGWCRICAKYGATSIPSCCTGGIWVSAAISKSDWRSASRRRWSYSRAWKR